MFKAIHRAERKEEALTSNCCPLDTHAFNYQNLLLIAILMYKNHNTNNVNCVMMNLTKLEDVSAQSS